MIDTIEDLQKYSELLQEYLERPVSEEIAAVLEMGNNLSVYMAQSGKMLADAKAHQDKALCDSILKYVDSKLSPSTLNKLVSADCRETNYLVTWIGRINSACVHKMDWARTLISKAKAEMGHQNFGT